MLPFAVNLAHKMSQIPRQNLINLGLGVMVLVVVVVLIKFASRINKFLLFTVILVTVVVVTLTWVYERNEPKFLSPVIDSIAPLFPSRPKY